MAGRQSRERSEPGQRRAPADDGPLRILVVTPRFPDPRGRGHQVRASHHARLLGQRHRLTLLSFTDEADGGPPAEAREVMRAACRRVLTVPRSRLASWRGAGRRLLSPVPLQVGLYESAAMHRALREALAGEPFDLLHVQLARLGPYLEHPGGPARVADLVDALSLNMRRRATLDRGPARWLARLEAARLLAYERRLCQRVDAAVVSSPVDRDAIGAFPNLTVVTNGVDLDAFPFAPGDRDPELLVFSGNLGYFPNVGAVAWLVERVLPAVRRGRPGARLRVVGARPSAGLARLARAADGVEVTGFVDRMAAAIARATVAVAPMQAGSGQPLKILEAMAVGTPVVATSLAAAGLDAVAGEHLLVADTPDAFAAAVLRLLGDPALGARLAASARRLVESRYTWERSTAELEAVFRSVMARRAD